MFISVIIPTFNRAIILKECLHALSLQDLDQINYEVIVVDDGSKDNTKEIVESFKSKIVNIRYIHQSNRGQGIARNLQFQWQQRADETEETHEVVFSAPVIAHAEGRPDP